MRRVPHAEAFPFISLKHCPGQAKQVCNPNSSSWLPGCDLSRKGHIKNLVQYNIESGCSGGTVETDERHWEKLTGVQRPECRKMTRWLFLTGFPAPVCA